MCNCNKVDTKSSAAGKGHAYFAAYRWLGLRWVGYPWPLRILARLLRRGIRYPGCGCVYVFKRAVIDPWAFLRVKPERWSAHAGDSIDRQLFALPADEAKRLIQAARDSTPQARGRDEAKAEPDTPSPSAG